MTHCTLGVGCDETGVCYASAHDRPEMCGREDSLPSPSEEGYKAFEAYMLQPLPWPVPVCPYPDGSKEFTEWEQGWEDAYQYRMSSD